jgi:hypothetical protein
MVGKRRGAVTTPVCQLLLDREVTQLLVCVVDELNVAIKTATGQLVIRQLDERENLEPRIVGDAHQIGHLDNLLDADITIVHAVDFFHIVLSILWLPTTDPVGLGK